LTAYRFGVRVTMLGMICRARTAHVTVDLARQVGMKADRRRSTVVVDTLSPAFPLTVPGTDLVALHTTGR
jgi:hypothetical protein